MSPRRWALARAGVVAVLASVLILGTDLQGGQPSPAKAAAVDACDVATLPGKPIDVVGGLVGVGGPDDVCHDVTGKAVGAIGGAAADVAGQIGGSIVEELAQKAGEGAIWLMGRAKDFAVRSTSPDVLNPAFTQKYQEMFALALIPALIMLLIVAVECVARADLGLLARTAFITTPAAMVAAAAAMALVQLLIAGVDSMSAGITADAGAEMGRFLDHASDAMRTSVGIGAQAGGAVGGAPGAIGGATVPIFIGLVGAILAVIAALILWLELLFRSAAIYAVALFVPFSVIGVIWPRARGWMTRTVELILVLVFSKFVIVAILSLSGTLVVDAGDFAVVLQATMLMLLAAFSPLILLKLVPFVENAAGAVSHRSSGGVALAGMQTASSGQMMFSVARRNWGGHGEPQSPASIGATGATESSAPGAAAATGAAVAGTALTVASSAQKVGEQAGKSLDTQIDPSRPAAPPTATERPTREVAPIDEQGPPRPARAEEPDRE